VALQLPIGLLQVPGTGLTLAVAGSLGWGTKTIHIRKIDKSYQM
jgi:hypothetical protein